MLFSNIKNIYISNKKLKELKINGQKVWTAEEPTPEEQDILQGLWLLNSSINCSIDSTFSVDFTSNGEEHSLLGIIIDEGVNSYFNYTQLRFDHTIIMEQNHPNSLKIGENSLYRYIAIESKVTEVTGTRVHGSTVTERTGYDLYDWLNNNAKKIEEPIKGAWKWNEKPLLEAGEYNFLFMSNGQFYSKLSVDENGTIKYDTTTIYSSSGWLNNNYKVLAFTESLASKTDITEIVKFGEILRANATKTTYSLGSTFTVKSEDGTQTASYTFEEGMRWRDFILSEYNKDNYFEVWYDGDINGNNEHINYNGFGKTAESVVLFGKNELTDKYETEITVSDKVLPLTYSLRYTNN